ncbi:MAG: TetR/AcrR family transcriptional regulator [Zoogloeaceae bacterium]|nr:TetR/AcrR family transcriptional regulator [Zoogloeaceae bacterium]
MRATQAATGDHPRGEARKTQILDAAADCFRDHGFHGASIAQISRSAGMSAGHIYHYFENKEAIIAAIVARDLERILSMSAELRSAGNVLQAMLDCTKEGVRENLDPKAAGLQLEIIAEAARNPRIAEVVRAADRQIRESLAETFRTARKTMGHKEDEQVISALTELLAAMFEGLAIRSIRNPDIDTVMLTGMFQRVITAVVAGAPTEELQNN